MRRGCAPDPAGSVRGARPVTGVHFPFVELNNAAYQSSKTALNALTVLYANELREAGGEGQRGQPRLPGHRAQRRAADPRGGGPGRRCGGGGGDGLMDGDGPTGEFHSDTGTVYPW